MRRTCTLLTAVLLISAGCQPTETAPIQTALPPGTERMQPAGPPLITVTPAAAEEFRNAAAEFAPGKVWRIRLTVKPGGCTGFQSKLDLDPTALEPGDSETTSDGIRFVYRVDQEFAVQGAEIDFVNTPKERGFSVKHPNKTEENRRRTTAWLDKELAAFRVPAESDDK